MAKSYVSRRTGISYRCWPSWVSPNNPDSSCLLRASKMTTPPDEGASISCVPAAATLTRRRKIGRCEYDEGSSVAGGTGLASTRGGRGRMRVGFRPGPAGSEEESRQQGSADPERSEAQGRGQKATGEERRRQKASAKEEGRRSGEEGKRPPEGSDRAAEEDKRPRAEGTGPANKPTEEGTKGAEEEGRSPSAGPPGEELDAQLVRERTLRSRVNREEASCFKRA